MRLLKDCCRSRSSSRLGWKLWENKVPELGRAVNGQKAEIGRMHVEAGDEQAPPSFLPCCQSCEEVGPGQLVPRLPSGEGGWVQPWMVLDCAAQSHMVQCARHPYPPTRYHQIGKIDSLIKSVLRFLASQHLLSSRSCPSAIQHELSPTRTAHSAARSVSVLCRAQVQNCLGPRMCGATMSC